MFDLEAQAVEADDLDGRQGSVGAHQKAGASGGMDHGMTECDTLRVIGHIPEALGHAVQAEVIQQVERGMSEQGASPIW
jgi:hypothetical protein